MPNVTITVEQTGGIEGEGDYAVSVASRNVIPRKLPERPKSPYDSSTAETDLADTSGRLVTMSSGNIVEIIGAVVDARFPRAAVPKVYDALKIENGLTLEIYRRSD